MNIIQQFLEDTLVQGVDKSLITYVEKHIAPVYARNDKGHDKNHMLDVISWGNNIAQLVNKQKPINISAVYCACAYHDIELYRNRDSHHMISGGVVRKHAKKLSQWFNDEEIELIAQACEDHRASNPSIPRSIYGKIVSDADRAPSAADIVNLIIRGWNFRRKHSPEMNNIDDIFENMFIYFNARYGKGGYANLILPESKKIIGPKWKKTRDILKSRQKFRKLFDQLLKKGIIKL